MKRQSGDVRGAVDDLLEAFVIMCDPLRPRYLMNNIMITHGI